MKLSCKANRAWLALLAITSSGGLLAQQAPAAELMGMVDNPCPPPILMPEAVRSKLIEVFITPQSQSQSQAGAPGFDAEFTGYFAALQNMGNQDWPSLCRFRADNARLQAAQARPQLVFIGDSITENWLLGDPDLFGNDFVNRGIGGQTSPQMLLRFQADVIALQPEYVHIMAGTNVVAGNTGPTTQQDFKNNIMSMVQLAQASDIRVLLGSIPPSAGFYWQPALQPAPHIRELNSWMQQYAAEQNLAYVDYFAALAGEADELPAALGNDGVHPNRDGYTIMRKLFESALMRAQLRE